MTDNLNDDTINLIIRAKLDDERADFKPTVKDRAADVVASWGGSWSFIAWFSVFVAFWIVLNTLLSSPIDGYPFILLNLILSCLSVFQAPFILMSQNRMSDIDRKRAEEDYKINLKAELEIKDLHRKLDELIALSHVAK